jgi:hypothetical protein
LEISKIILIFALSKMKNMSKKVIIVASAVLAFFAGAIWVSEVPVVATLVAFLEAGIGFTCGFFFNRELNKEAMAASKNEVNSLKEAITGLKCDLTAKELELKKVQTITKAVKEERPKPKKGVKPATE